MPVHACTIIARNYLPLARVLAGSFRTFHPDGELTVLIFDDAEFARSLTGEPFEVVSIDDLGEDVPELYRMAMMYELTEFATAVKPWLLQYLLWKGVPAALYLDPDIQVFDSLATLAQLAADHGVVLTPHATAPMPRDGRMTSETSILAAGIYNLGFIGVGQGSREPGRRGRPPFLEFWKQRLLRECVIDPQGMRFVDQRWIDFVPAVYEPHIMREPTYNVAYWNLDHRDLQWSGGRYEIDGQPLRFFHFSGYTPHLPHVLSKFQGERPRILLSERPAVRRICHEYGELLLASGFDERGVYAYPFDTMANGVPIDRYVRAIYRDAVRHADDGDDVYPPVPWDRPGADALCDWLTKPPRVEGDAGRLSVYLATVYATHVHALRLQFFDPQAADHDRYLAWAQSEAAAGRLIEALLEPSLPPGSSIPHQAEAPRWAGAEELRPGIVVAGYLKAELGVGEGARLLVASIDAAGVPYSTYVFGETLSRQEHVFVQEGEGTGDFDVAVICVNADQVPLFARTVGPGFFAGRYRIGQWAWELEEFPDRWPESFDGVDEIWAISEFSRRAIAARTDKPVLAAPLAIVPPVVPPGIGRAELGLPEDRTVFLFCFDLLSVLDRKNPLGLVEAYTRAFPDGQATTLVLKVINGDKAVYDLERIRMATLDRTDIEIIDRYLDEGELGALIQACDCYVSLHRSEGFGLTMGEAMALGKPVIATAYSGNLDFMDEDTAYLVPWAYGTVPADCDPYPVGAKWAEPDLSEAARLMRLVADHPDQARSTGERARSAVAARHGPQARAAFVRQRFEEIERQREAQAAAAAVAAEAGRPGRLKGLLRRSVRRMASSDRVMRFPRAAVRRLRALADPS